MLVHAQINERVTDTGQDVDLTRDVDGDDVGWDGPGLLPHLLFGSGQGRRHDLGFLPIIFELSLHWALCPHGTGALFLFCSGSHRLEI